MKIEAGKRYMMRYGGISGPLRLQHNGCWTDDEHRWFDNGSYNSFKAGSLDLISEYNPHAAPCELRSGGKYVLDNGKVVTLRESIDYYPTVMPFRTVENAAAGITASGEMHFRYESDGAVARITGEFIEPKPPTPIERLERWHAGYMKNTGYAETLEAIIADLKAEATK